MKNLTKPKFRKYFLVIGYIYLQTENLTSTHGGISNVFLRVLVKVGSTLLALSTNSVVATVLAHSSGHTTGRIVNSRIEMTLVSMVVAVARWKQNKYENGTRAVFKLCFLKVELK